jgi:uncharacterized Zn finger protein (UPF0148 family)
MLENTALEEMVITNISCPRCEYRLVEHDSKRVCLNCGYSIDYSDDLSSALTNY